jgi:hypothetical protein
MNFIGLNAPRLRQASRLSLDQKSVAHEVAFITPLGFSNCLPDVLNLDCIHTVTPQVFDVALDQIDRCRAQCHHDIRFVLP